MQEQVTKAVPGENNCHFCRIFLMTGRHCTKVFLSSPRHSTASQSVTQLEEETEVKKTITSKFRKDFMEHEQQMDSIELIINFCFSSLYYLIQVRGTRNVSQIEADFIYISDHTLFIELEKMKVSYRRSREAIPSPTTCELY